MKRTTKTFIAIAVAAFACGFSALQLSSEIVLGNQEALSQTEIINGITFDFHTAYQYDENKTAIRVHADPKHGFCAGVTCNGNITGVCWELVVTD